jgi:hypothetical protein
MTRPRVEREEAGPAAKGLFLAGLAAVAVGRYLGTPGDDRPRDRRSLEEAVGDAE